MEFFRQEYWSGLLFPSPGDLPDPGIELGSPVLQADSLPFEPPAKPKKRGAHPGFDPGTSCTLSENHTPRPMSYTVRFFLSNKLVRGWDGRG